MGFLSLIYCSVNYLNDIGRIFFIYISYILIEIGIIYTIILILVKTYKCDK